MSVLLMEGISKSYVGNRVLKAIDFSLKSGEVKALLGENGAGKSTLIKILSGAVMKDEGDITIDGVRADIQSPQDSIRFGVSVIYQEFTLVPQLSIAENIFLGRLLKKGPVIKWNKMYEHSQSLLERLGSNLDVRRKVATLGVADQQLVEIAKALSAMAKIIIMDEPTAALSKNETGKLFEIIGRLKAQGVAIVYVSHRLEEIFEIADSVAILRDGVKAADVAIDKVTPSELIKQMVGREVAEQTNQREKNYGVKKLEVKHANYGKALTDINLSIYSGQIVGITGLIGAGQSELVQCLFGIRHFQSGVIEVEGKVVQIKSPKHAIRSGIGLIPEDRRKMGLVLGMSIMDNVSLASLDKVSQFSFFNKTTEAKLSEDMIDKLKIKTTNKELQVRKLSGGNQQKVVIAKWLAKESNILIFHEPTRGIDVGAKEEIYRLMQSLAQRGAAILVVSSDIHEVLSISNKLIVMREGRFVFETDPLMSSKEEVLLHAAGSGSR